VNYLSLRTKELDCEEKGGDTILFVYLRKKDYEMVRKLLIRGANPNYQNRFGLTALHVAMQQDLEDRFFEII